MAKTGNGGSHTDKELTIIQETGGTESLIAGTLKGADDRPIDQETLTAWYSYFKRS